MKPLKPSTVKGLPNSVVMMQTCARGVASRAVRRLLPSPISTGTPDLFRVYLAPAESTWVQVILGGVMSDEDDWDFVGDDDPSGNSLFTQGYYRRARSDIVQEIISIVRQVASGPVASGPPPGQPDPLDDDMPGG
jgi:hypothetical protein